MTLVVDAKVLQDVRAHAERLEKVPDGSDRNTLVSYKDALQHVTKFIPVLTELLQKTKRVEATTGVATVSSSTAFATQACSAAAEPVTLTPNKSDSTPTIAGH